MTLLDFIRLLSRHAKLLVSTPLVSALVVWVLTNGAPAEYRSVTTVYTGLVSGYTIDSDRARRADHLQISTGFDNLINTIRSTVTIREVALKLIDMQLSGQLNVEQVNLDEFIAPLLDSSLIFSANSRQSDESQLDGLVRLAQDPETPVHQILFGDPSPFNVESISDRLEVKRVGVSDLLSMSYTAEDPNLAHATLSLISETFMRKFGELKKREASTVLDYFNEQTENAHARLQDAVERMKQFGTENRIINYYEQTKYIASQKELIDQQLQQEQMRLKAAESALSVVEEKLESTSEILAHSNQLMAKQQAVATLMVSIALREAVGEDPTELRKQMSETNSSLHESIRSLYRANHTAHGLAKEQLVAAWLVNLLEVSQRRAALDVLQNRRDSYQAVYDDFAPLGATLSSFEREVGIAEEEYLELLHSLNQAKLRQQSIKLGAELEVVDSPNLPVKPEPSKSSLLIMLAVMTSFTLLVGALVAADTLDQTLQSPRRATERTGLEVASGFPSSDVMTDHPNVEQILSTQLLNNILLNQDDACSVESRRVFVVARDNRENVSLVSKLLERKIADRDGEENVFVVRGARTEAAVEGSFRSVGDSTWVIVEMPRLWEDLIPVSALRSAKTILLVADASLVWSDADTRLCSTLQNLNANAVRLVLTNVKPSRLDEFLGEWPRERTWLRERAKRLARFEFGV